MYFPPKLVIMLIARSHGITGISHRIYVIKSSFKVKCLPNKNCINERKGEEQKLNETPLLFLHDNSLSELQQYLVRPKCYNTITLVCYIHTILEVFARYNLSRGKSVRKPQKCKCVMGYFVIC